MNCWLDALIDRVFRLVEEPKALLRQAFVDLQSEAIGCRETISLISEGKPSQAEICQAEIIELERALTVLNLRLLVLTTANFPPQAKPWAIRSAYLGEAWASWSRVYRAILREKSTPNKRGRPNGKLQAQLDSILKRIRLLEADTTALQKELLRNARQEENGYFMKGFARDGETERDLYFSTVSTARDKLAALRDLHAGPANANQGETSEIKSIDLVDQIEDLMQLLDLLTCVSG